VILAPKHCGHQRRLSYDVPRRSAPFKQGGLLFKRTTYQHGSLKLEERKRGPHVWVFRWWDTDANGTRLYRKQQVGDLSEYPNESAAQAAVDTLRLTINHQSQRNRVSQMTVQSLWEHYSREELPFKDFSTQDGYSSYAKNWILPRWGHGLLRTIKTVEVERWLRAATGSNGTKAKSSASCRLCSRTPFVGSSLPLIRSLQELQWARVGSAVPARVFV